MYVKEELKLNKFRDVSIPSGREYFMRYGYIQSPGNKYTGDELAQMPQNKVDSLADYMQYAESEAERQSQESE